MAQCKDVSLAVAGKGGTGKTTISGIIIAHLINHTDTRVLAVDADPSTNLGFILGKDMTESLGDIREETIDSMMDFSPGMTKAAYLELRINQAVQEYDRFDLLSMGRPEGPGCYCYVNRLLRTALDTLSHNYDYVVMDCEAGMEHVSRRTSRAVDHLLIVTDTSVRGFDVAVRISDLADSLKNGIGKKHLLVNRSTEEIRDVMSGRIEKAAEQCNFSSVTILPDDRMILGMDMEGKSVFDLSGKDMISGRIEALLNREIRV